MGASLPEIEEKLRSPDLAKDLCSATNIGSLAPSVVRRGYAAIGLHHPKNCLNVGGVIRAAHCYSAAIIAISGPRKGARDVLASRANVTKAERHLPVICGDDLHALIPFDCVPVAVDLIEGAIELQNYQHPARAFYIFGPEDGTLGTAVTSWCRDKIMVPTRLCMNLAATVNVVLYDRLAKQLLDTKKDAERLRFLGAA